MCAINLLTIVLPDHGGPFVAWESCCFVYLWKDMYLTLAWIPMRWWLVFNSIISSLLPSQGQWVHASMIRQFYELWEQERRERKRKRESECVRERERGEREREKERASKWVGEWMKSKVGGARDGQSRVHCWTPGLARAECDSLLTSTWREVCVSTGWVGRDLEWNVEYVLVIEPC